MVESKRGTLIRRLAITSTYLPLLIRVAELIGGKIHAHRAPVNTHKQQFQWYSYGDHVRAVLHGVFPYLTAKGAEARIYLTFDRQRVPGRPQLLDWERQQRRVLLEQVRQIRHRAWRPDDVPTVFRPNKRT